MTETSVRGVKLDYLPSPTSLQRLSVAVQRGKAASVLGSIGGLGPQGFWDT